MKLTVTPYEQRHIPLVKAFNKRLQEKGDPHHFPESNVPVWLPKRTSAGLFQEYFVIGDDEAVRGGYILKHQDFFLSGKQTEVLNLQMPISEGIVYPQYTLIAALLARDALRRAPLMYTLGLGGYTEPITRLYHALRWKLLSVPFYFKLLNSNAFFRKNAYMRSSPARRLLLDLAAVSGIGAAAVHAAQFLQTAGVPRPTAAIKEMTPCDEDVEAIWRTVKTDYSLIGIRDSRTIDILYPPSEARFRRTKIYAHGQCLGWVVTLRTQMKAHKQFGSLCVGSIVDCLGRPGDAQQIIQAAVSILEEQGVDLIVANHSHRAWGRAFHRNGFLRGPSNFIFGASVELVRQLDALHSDIREIFFMRGDGDGPINL
jgi:hypothetical protein